MAHGQLRRGVTLLELLVVLVLIGISAALVVPAMRLPGAEAGARGNVGRVTAVDAVITDARRLAIKRGQPVHLRVASDGVWAVAPAAGGAALLAGRVTEALEWLPDVHIDALGTCLLAAGTVPPGSARAWDALACRWREARA